MSDKQEVILSEQDFKKLTDEIIALKTENARFKVKCVYCDNIGASCQCGQVVCLPHFDLHLCKKKEDSWLKVIMRELLKEIDSIRAKASTEIFDLHAQIDGLKDLLEECEKSLSWPEERHLELHERVRNALKEPDNGPAL